MSHELSVIFFINLTTNKSTQALDLLVVDQSTSVFRQGSEQSRSLPLDFEFHSRELRTETKTGYGSWMETEADV